MKLRTEVQKDIKIHRGDTHHPVEFRLVNMHNFLPIDISNATAKFFLMKDEASVLESDVNLEHGMGGIGRYDWKKGETDTPGNYKGYFELVCSNGNYFRIPEGTEFIKIVID